MLYLYNTLSRRKEKFAPINSPLVTYYSCGPTVYDYAHIGHARTFIFADVLQRALELNNFKVKRVMNITDVGHLTSDRDSGEDKMEKGAKRENKSVWDIAEFYTQDFMLMLEKLNIKVPEIICKATDNIDSMIRIISTLQEKGFTYKTKDGMYFDTTKFPDYGKLTGQSFASLQKTLKAGARIEMVEGKKHPTDFALWKFSYPKGRSFDSAQDDAGKRRQMEWDSPFAPTQGREGRGFPGWHIECSAMSMKYLGKTIDIHTGGVDHIPIHHTNEIAQSEAANGKPFVRFWLHAEHLTVEGEKMSKSLHNFYRLKDINEKGYDSLALRYLFLTAHYRTAMNFTWKSMSGASQAYKTLIKQITNIRQPSFAKASTFAEALVDESAGRQITEKSEKRDGFRRRFKEVVNDDLNTASGLAVVWEVVKSDIPSSDKYDLLLEFDKVLGLGLSQITENLSAPDYAGRQAGKKQITIPVEVKNLVEKREGLRRVKNWDEADKLRSQIEESGFIVEDTPQGSTITRK